MNGADAVERLMSSYKEIVELVGYTSRVGEMLRVFDQAKSGNYVRSTANLSKTTKNLSGASLVFENGRPVAKGEVWLFQTVTKPFFWKILLRIKFFIFLLLGRTTETTDGTISIINVPIITPNCDVVVRSLTLNVTPGQHILITGNRDGDGSGLEKREIFSYIYSSGFLYFRTKRLRKIVPLQNTFRFMACLQWSFMQARFAWHVLRSSTSLHELGQSSRSGHLSGHVGRNEIEGIFGQRPGEIFR